MIGQTTSGTLKKYLWNLAVATVLLASIFKCNAVTLFTIVNPSTCQVQVPYTVQYTYPNGNFYNPPTHTTAYCEGGQTVNVVYPDVDPNGYLYYSYTNQVNGTSQTNEGTIIYAGPCVGGYGTIAGITDPAMPDSSQGPTTNPDCNGDDVDGMPVWSVSEPSICLFLRDRPLSYQPAVGPPISLDLAYKQRGTSPTLDVDTFSFGRGWNCSWLSYVGLNVQPGSSNVFVYLPNGVKTTFYGTNDYLTDTRLTGNTNIGYTLEYPDGSKTVYGFIVRNGNSFEKAMMSEQWNATGQKTRFEYNSVPTGNGTVNVALNDVIDGDGNTNIIFYSDDTTYSYNLIARIWDPYGRTVSFAYDDTGHLTNIVDAVTNSSSLKYDASGFVTNLVTPYGTTSFTITDEISMSMPTNGRSRSIVVTRPDGSHEMFLYTNNAAGIANSYSTSAIPDTTPYTNTLDTNDLAVRNSFYWGPRQYANLSTTNISSLTANDFRLARMKHWLRTSTNLVGTTLSMQRDSSPDNSGATEGQKTWYDYAGKTNIEYEGTQCLPLCVAQILPDGTTSFVRDVRNSFGSVTTNVATCSVGSGVGVRTNIFLYSTNNIDLVAVTNALGIRTVTNTYNSVHEVLKSINALNETNSFTYDTNNRLTSITRPNGLVTTNKYGTDKYLATVIDVGFATNSYTYSNALVYSHTDARGLTVTNTWDNLNRLTSTTFPDGTYISNCYTFLDLTATKDRLDHWSYFGYDQLRHNTNFVDRLGNTNVYSYCSCGALDSVRDPLGNFTHYYYDNQMRVTNVVYPDNYSVTNFYNLIGQITNTVDSFGASVTNIYNNQGLLTASSNVFGRVQAAIFDVLDRATNSTDANGVTVSTTYDNLNRVLSRTYPDAGVEKWAYTQKIVGATSYTNQVTNIVTYGYDAMARLTNQVNVGIRTNKFFYNGAGDLTNLVDGNSQSTKWGYDVFGRNTNKVDATSATILTFKYDAENRMTNRTSAAKGATTYSYDNEGNLLTVAYPTSPSISFSYDAMNRMTNMTDAVGTSTFTYTAAGQLQSEDGPWSSDTITYSYNNRLRSGFTLQEPIGASLSQTYGYDVSRRLTNITSTAGAFTYAYDPVRNLQIQKLTLPNSAYITNAYDSVSRLTDTWLKNSSGTILNYHGYVINKANQRSRQTRFNNDYVDYTYDAAGQLKTAFGKESGGSPLRYNEQLGYRYDAAGNLQYRTNYTLIQTFVVNSLNELTNVKSSGKITVEGTTTSVASSVTVNGTNALIYSDATFAATNMPLVNSYTAVAHDSYGRVDTNAITLNLSTNVILRYDANGNLTNDNLRTFQYDDENQLISIWATNAWKSDFGYDGLRRRRAETNYVWSGGAWVKSNERRFVYDGNLVIEERDANNQSQVYYTRGRDLGGTLASAGGIGGLLARTPTSGYITSISAAHAFYFSDENGNVTTLIGTNQLVAAKYIYDSFGNTLSRSGPLADVNLYRFSSKETDLNSGLIYFGQRFYDPNLQRWINRDPASERGGANLFSFIYNNPIGGIDPSGCWGIAFGNSAGTSSFNIGLGDPSYYLSASAFNNYASDYAASDAGRFFGNIGLNLGAVIKEGIDAQQDPLGSAWKKSKAIAALYARLGQLAGNPCERERARKAMGQYILSPEGISDGTLIVIGIIGGIPEIDGVAVDPSLVVEQYSLRAADGGYYPVMVRGAKEPQFITYLEKGDLWKFGTTQNPETRYSQSYLDNLGEHGVEYTTEFSGTLQEARTLQNMKIQNYRFQTGRLPPGNKIVN